MTQIRPFSGLLLPPEASSRPGDGPAVPPGRPGRGDPERLYRPGRRDAPRGGTRGAREGGVRERGARVPGGAETGPALFPYEMRFQHDGRPRAVRGVIVEAALEPWGRSIVPHERTLRVSTSGGLRRLRAARANLSPVYALVRGPVPALASFLAGEVRRAPDWELVDGAGTRHRLWVSRQGLAAVTTALARETLLLADGHHRYAAALAHRERRRRAAGPGAWDGLMMLVVDAADQDPPVLPIHRVVVQPPWPAPAGERVRDLAEVLAGLDDGAGTYGSVTLEDGVATHRVASLPDPPPVVGALHRRVLDALAPGALRFVPDAVAAENAVLTGSGRSAFLLPPTTVERVWDTVAAGRRLPEKSTYFWPKPRSGMLVRPLE